MLEDYHRNHNKNIEIFCFFEELPVTGIGKVCGPTGALSWISYILLSNLRSYPITPLSSALIPTAVFTVTTCK